MRKKDESIQEFGKKQEREDRYHRLRAITDFGYNITWEELKDKKIVVAGVGGLGVIIANQLARCGVGQMSLFDMDIVKEVNLNRMGYRPEDVGKPKVEVVAKQISKINPEVAIDFTHGDIMSWEIDQIFDKAVIECDLVMMGLDNFPARMFVNQKCVNTKKVLINAGVSRSALSGFVHPVFPGLNSCLMCSGVIHGKNEKKERSAERCNASLPTTMAMISSIQVQEALKLLLNFGETIDYLNYNAVSGQFHHFRTRPDPNCAACKDVCLNESDYSEFKNIALFKEFYEELEQKKKERNAQRNQKSTISN